MLSSHLGSKQNPTTSGLACNHLSWTTHTVKWHWAWHAIIAFGLHTQLERVGLGMPACSLGSIHGRTTSGVGCHQVWHVIIALRLITRSDNIMCGMPSSVILRKCILTHYILNFPQFWRKLYFFIAKNMIKENRFWNLEYPCNTFENVYFNVR